MTDQEKKFLQRINDYADEVLADIDPQKTQISVQLEKLKPIMEEIAKEEGRAVEDVFIQYMDLASEASVKREQEFQAEFNNPFNNPKDEYNFK